MEYVDVVIPLGFDGCHQKYTYENIPFIFVIWFLGGKNIQHPIILFFYYNLFGITLEM